MSTAASTPARGVLADLQAIFGARLEAFVVYAPTHTPRPSVAIVQSMALADLMACAARAARWHQAGAATPVVLTRREFARSLDAFPVEFGEIIDTHETLFGDDPFAGLQVAAARPAPCLRGADPMPAAALARGLHGGGRRRPRRGTGLVVDSAPEFRALLSLLARLDGQRLTGRDLAAWAAERLGARSADRLRRAARRQHARRQRGRRRPALPRVSRRRRAARAAHRRVVTDAMPRCVRCRWRQRGIALGTTLVLALGLSSTADAQPAPPELTAPVNDFAGVVDADVVAVARPS